MLCAVVSALTTGPLPVGDEEGLGGDVVGHAGSQAARDVPVDLAEVPVEDLREGLGRVEGTRGIGRAFLIWRGFRRWRGLCSEALPSGRHVGRPWVRPSGRTALTSHRPQARSAFTAGRAGPEAEERKVLAR